MPTGKSEGRHALRNSSFVPGLIVVVIQTTN